MYVVGLLGVCWPMRSYRAAAVAIVGGSLGSTTVSLGNLCLLLAGPYAPPFKPVWLLYAGPVYFAGTFAIVFLLLAAIVYVRKRFWPFYEPGRCRVCDYDLRGLPEPRCPECGTPFDPGEAMNLLSPP